MRVVLTGSESTGKTTLAAELAEWFAAAAVAESSRIYAEAKSAPLTADDVGPIAELWCERAEEVADEGLVIFDTDLLSTVVYGRHYYGECPDWIEGSLRMMKGDLYLLLDIDVPWIPDPARDRGDRREEMQLLFRDALIDRKLPFVDVRGSWEERRRIAIEAVERLMEGEE